MIRIRTAVAATAVALLASTAFRLDAAVAGARRPLGLDLYMPVPDSNPLTTERVELGRRLFNDRRLSSDGSTSCASCHDAKRSFSTADAHPTGVFGRRARRNAGAIVNRGYGRAFFWDGRAATLEEQVLQPIQDPNEMDLTVEEASKRVGVDARTMSRSLASYVRSILSGDSAYDRFVAGNRRALSDEQQRGLSVFRGRGNCASCHVGPTFSDERFHNTGVAWQGSRFTDDGRFGVTKNEHERGAFKTPTLREVMRTGPYMHDGSFASLEEVVAYYSRGGNANPQLDPEIRVLNLTPSEQRDLVAFLEALTGTVWEGTRVFQ